MGLSVDDPIYHKGVLFAHVVAKAIQDLPFGSYMEVDVDSRLSYGMLELVLDGSTPLLEYVKCGTLDLWRLD